MRSTDSGNNPSSVGSGTDRDPPLCSGIARVVRRLFRLSPAYSVGVVVVFPGGVVVAVGGAWCGCCRSCAVGRECLDGVAPPAEDSSSTAMMSSMLFKASRAVRRFR